MNEYKQAVKAKNQSIPQLVHDSRNQLNRISVQAELVKMLVENNADPQKIHSALDKILHACEACGEKLNEIKD